MEDSDVDPTKRLFEFGTNEAIVFKQISKALHKIFIDSVFIITSHGIFLQDSLEGNSLVLELRLKSQKFTPYNMPTFEREGSSIVLGFSTKDFKDALERITKTDHFCMYVLEANPNYLHMEIWNPNKSGRVYKFITLKRSSINDILTSSYQDHNPTVSILPTQFKKATADAGKNSKNLVLITGQKRGLKIEGIETQLTGLKEVFGEWIEGSQDIVYQQYISTKRLVAFSEIVALSKNVQVYATIGKPLKISCSTGDLGMASIYLKGEKAPNSNNNNQAENQYAYLENGKSQNQLYLQ